MLNVAVITPIAELSSPTLSLIRVCQNSLRKAQLHLVSTIDDLKKCSPLEPVVVPPYEHVSAAALVRTIGLHAAYSPPSAAYGEIIDHLIESAHPVIALGASALNFVPSNISVQINPFSDHIRFSSGSGYKEYLTIGTKLFLYVKGDSDLTYAGYVRDIITAFFIEGADSAHASIV